MAAPPPQNLRAVGDRIEQLLDELRASADPRSYARAEELLRLVTDLYGGGLARIVELAGERCPEVVERLVEDELVASLLLVHGLHPESLQTRVEQALGDVRPFLAQHDGGVELLDLDPDAGAVLLRLLGNCDGCPSSAVTLRHAVERAIVEAAPEIVTIDVEELPPPGGHGAGLGGHSGHSGQTGQSGNGHSVPVTLGRKPVYESCPSEVLA